MDYKRLNKFGWNLWFVLLGGVIFNFRLVHEWEMMSIVAVIVLGVVWMESK